VPSPRSPQRASERAVVTQGRKYHQLSCLHSQCKRYQTTCIHVQELQNGRYLAPEILHEIAYRTHEYQLAQQASEERRVGPWEADDCPFSLNLESFFDHHLDSPLARSQRAAFNQRTSARRGMNETSERIYTVNAFVGTHTCTKESPEVIVSGVGKLVRVLDPGGFLVNLHIPSWCECSCGEKTPYTGESDAYFVFREYLIPFETCIRLEQEIVTGNLPFSTSWSPLPPPPPLLTPNPPTQGNRSGVL
jgi:hypothetical protein